MSDETVQSARNVAGHLLRSSTDYVQQLTLPSPPGVLYDCDLRALCFMPDDLSKLSRETNRWSQEYSRLVTNLAMQRAKLAAASIGTEEHAVISQNISRVKKDIAQNDADTANLIIHRNRLASTW